MQASSLGHGDQKIYNHFMQEFCGTPRATYGNIQGRINTTVSAILISNFTNKDNFIKEIEKAPINHDLKTKAIQLSDKYFKIVQFKALVGGQQFANSQSTLNLTEMYLNFLNKEISKEDLLQEAQKLPHNIFNNIKNFIEPPQVTPLKVPPPETFLKPSMLAKIEAENAKREMRAQNAQISSSATSQSSTTAAQSFKLGREGITTLYNNKLVVRHTCDHTSITNSGGAVNVGYDIAATGNAKKVGIMIAANAGLPGGALGRRPNQITEEDLKMKTQEESVWGNAVLTSVGTDPSKQQSFHDNTISNKWGLASPSSTSTLQGIDYTTSANPEDYNQAFIVDNCKVSCVDSNKSILPGTDYPVVFSFACSVNANPKAGQPGGTVQRTLSQEAIHDYEFFRNCIKECLRSNLDGLASKGVTHALVAQLSCGIYAGAHQDRIRQEFDDLLDEVLAEHVGPHQESRGQYFEEVIIPKIS